MHIGKHTGNNKWPEAINLEIDQQHKHNSYKEILKGPPPKSYKKIRIPFVFYIKHDGRHKTRLVSDSHLTDFHLSSVHSAVAHLRGIHIVLFLAQLNDLEPCSTDIGNSCLEVFTKERCT